MRRGALDLDLPEAKLSLDPTSGAPLSVTRRTHDPGIRLAYQMVEDMMLLANELVAGWLAARKAPAIYRVHGAPDEERLEHFAKIAAKLGAPFEAEDLGEPRGVSRYLRSIQEHPRRLVLEGLLLRSLKQAAYDLSNIGHFGLASETYLHFTSPIRRYPDLVVHRQVKSILRGKVVDRSPRAMEELRLAATEVSTRERSIMQIEREIVDLYRTLYMRDRVGEIFEGAVTAITGGGLYVALDEPFVDVLIRFEALGPDHYQVDDDELAVVGLKGGERVELGERVVVQIEDAAVLRRTVYARRVVPEKTLKQPRKRGQRTAKTKGRQRDRGQRKQQPSRAPKPRRGKKKRR